MRSTVSSRPFGAPLLERLLLLDGDVGTPEAEFARDCVCVWREYDNVIVVDIDGA